MIKQYKKIKDKIVSINWDTSWENENATLQQLIQRRQKFPKSPIYNSYFQYKAQVVDLKIKDKLLLGVISFFGFFFLVFKYFLRNAENTTETSDIAFFYSESIFASELIENKKLVKIELEQGELSLNDIGFLFSTLFKLRFNFGLLSIATYRIAQVRFAKKKYGVSEIWTNMEFSASCGILKSYCNKNDITYSNFMHGEKVLTLRDSFCSFDKMYVWSDEHRDIFLQLHCQSDIIVSNPWKSSVSFEIKNDKSLCYFFKGIETDTELNKITTILNYFETQGYNISLKLHPRRLFKNDLINKYTVVGNDKNAFEILNDFEFVMAQYSTILTQAWCSKKSKIIVDDESNKKLVSSLIDRNYIFANTRENAIRLSSLNIEL